MSSLLFRLLAGAGAAPSLIADPRFALVGDSLTQYANYTVGLSGCSMVRDAAGVVTVTKTNHGISGTALCYVMNCVDDVSYEAMAIVTSTGTNTFTYPTGVTGLAGSITGSTLTAAAVQTRFSIRGYWAWLQSSFTGGARMVGNFGQGGDRADEMATAVALACATAAEFVVLCAGINDINSFAASGATVVSRIQTHITTILAAGKKVVLVGITPLGSANATNSKNTETLDANTGLAALANGTTIFFANAHPDLVDTGATQFTTGQAFSWVTYDGIHWAERAAKIIAQKIYDAIRSKVTVVNCLPTSLGNFPTIPGFTAIRELGAWSATDGGFNGTGSSGTVAPKTQVFSSNAATTVVNSLVDRGAALGYYQRQVITSGGAHTVTDYFLTNAGNTVASLGLTASDTVMFAIEYSMGGVIAGNISGINAIVQTNGSGGFGRSTAGNPVANSNSTNSNDSVTDVILMTGELSLNASVTHISAILEVRTSAVGTAATLDVGRVVLFKKN